MTIGIQIPIETTIADEIEAGAYQRQIAQTYAIGLKCGQSVDWTRVNRLIINRWSVAGLMKIKRMAWKENCFQKGK